MTFLRFLDVVKGHRTTFTHYHRRPLREGQAATAVLYRTNERVHRMILGTDKDPFYDDSRLEEFYAFVRENWENHT
jgi:hypothetical protein